MMKKIMVTRKIVKSRVSGFSRSKLETGRKGLGLCTAISRVQKLSLCFQGLARAFSCGVRRRFVRRIT